MEPTFQARREPLHGQVRDHIALLITNGTYRPGHALPSERELAEAHGVSRNTVRQALSSLEMLGLVTAKHGSGVFVSEGQSDEAVLRFAEVLFGREADAASLLEARLGIEPTIAALAAERRTESDLKVLRAAMKGVPDGAGGVDGFQTIKHGFHRHLAMATKNPVLDGLIRPLLLGPRHLAALVAHAPERNFFTEDHDAIYAAVEDRQPDLARDLMSQHLMRLASSQPPLN